MSAMIAQDMPNNHPRLTCYSIECNGATLVHQVYMTPSLWSSKQVGFMSAHPTKIVTSADGGERNLSWNGVNFGTSPN